MPCLLPNIDHPSRQMKGRVALLASAILPLVAAQASTSDPALPNLLLYTRTTGFHHESIPAAVQAIAELGEGLWTVTATEDPSVFSEEGLAAFNATAFISTQVHVLASSIKAEGFAERETC